MDYLFWQLSCEFMRLEKYDKVFPPFGNDNPNGSALSKLAPIKNLSTVLLVLSMLYFSQSWTVFTILVHFSQCDIVKSCKTLLKMSNIVKNTTLTKPEGRCSGNLEPQSYMSGVNSGAEPVNEYRPS